MGTAKEKGKTKQIPKKQNRGQTHKHKNKNRWIHFFLILFALLYLPALWKWIFHGSIETNIIHSGILEMKIPAEGVFIRNEISVESPKEGIIIPKVDQGERVPNKFNFAIVIDKSSQKALEDIENLEKNILRQVAEDNPESLEGNNNLQNQIQEQVNKLTDMAVNKSISAVEQVKSALERLIYQRNREIFESGNDRLYLENEKYRLEQLRQNLNKTAIPIESDFSGIVVWDTATKNEKYVPDNMEQLTVEELTINNTEQVESRTIGIDETFMVQKKQTFVRLVNNEKSWYVCVIDGKDRNKLKKGDTLSLNIDEIEELIPCKVEFIQQLGEKFKVIISFTQFVEKTVHLNRTKAELIIESIEGLKVPQRSLANRNSVTNTADIYLVRLNRAVVKRVKIIAEQDNFVIIDKLPESNETDPVRIFDIYVVNPLNIEEGQVIE